MIILWVWRMDIWIQQNSFWVTHTCDCDLRRHKEKNMPTSPSMTLPNSIFPRGFWSWAAALRFPTSSSCSTTPWQSVHGTGPAHWHLKQSSRSSGDALQAEKTLVSAQKLLYFWPSGLLWVEQVIAHWSFTTFRRFRSSLLLLTWSLSCSGLCSSSDPNSPKLQHSASPPVKSTRASDTCPAHSRSYEPWSLKRIERTGNGTSKLN